MQAVWAVLAVVKVVKAAMAESVVMEQDPKPGTRHQELQYIVMATNWSPHNGSALGHKWRLLLHHDSMLHDKVDSGP